MNRPFLDAMQNRRSFYAISNASPVSQEEISDLVAQAVLHVPSAFNCQSGRVVVLFDDAHTKLWSITMETLRGIVPSQKFAPTEEKINSFGSGYGTVLFFNDDSVTNGLIAQFPSYSANFPIWAHQSGGMLQFSVWSLLEQAGLGASLQHYNPLIDAQVKAVWNLPDSWQLLAQMPFGKPTSQPKEKEFQPIKERLLIFNK